ncbi:MAG: PAS domain S-box protein [Myxococcota bacterium]|nr:PAS domain S-box protein [Myxococcota bacterium]
MTGPESEESGAWAPPRSDPKRYRILFDTAPVMYHSLDASGRVIECNSTECRALGYKWSELVGKHITEILAPEDAARWPADFAELIEHGSLRSLERRLLRQDGTPIDVLVDVAVEHDSEGKLAYTKAVFVDITERKRLEAALRDSHGQLETVFNGIRDLLILHDTALRIVRINRCALERLGISEDQAVGRSCHVVFHGLAEPCAGCPVLRALRDGRETHGEATSPAGVFDVHAYPILDGCGAVTGVVEYARDITAERRLRAEAVRSEKLRSLGQLAGGVAHDFNNLLAAMKGYASLLLADEAGVERRAALKGILAAANRAADLTRRLLSFAGGGSGPRGRVALNCVATEAAELVQRTVDPAVHVRVELDPEDPVVVGDASALHNAVLNLCLNARDAMPSGGALTVTTRAAAAPAGPPAAGGTDRGASYAAVDVADTGAGIPPELHGRIFEPFFTTKGEGGTGLGLSTVYGIAQAHDGRIEFETQVGKGSTFRLLIPRAAPDRDSNAAGAVRPGAWRPSLAPDLLGRPARVLVVEDEPFVRFSLARMLRRLGYEPLPAASAKDALDAAASPAGAPVDVVLLDLRVPDMGPRQIIERLRDAGVAAPVLLMSGDAGDPRIADLLGAGAASGAAAFVAKPFDIETLGEELAGLVARSEPTGGSGAVG